jgi:dGTPase
MTSISGRFDSLSEQQRADFLHFEGNAQTLRLTCHLQLLTDRVGLNLTYGTLSAASKYLAASHQVQKGGPHQYKKPGYFASEQDVVDTVRRETKTGSYRNPITYLVEAADDIVYSTVDLEDGLKKRVLDWDIVQDALKASDLGRATIAATHERVDNSDLALSARKDAYAIVFRTIAISHMVPAVLETFKKRYKLIMKGEYERELVADPECVAKDLIEISKTNILRKYLYTDPSILKLEIRGRAVLHGLMDLFWEATDNVDISQPPQTHEYAGKLYLLISDNYRQVFENRIKQSPQIHPEFYVRLQLVTDQVAGMTDTYACRLHKELFNGN